MSHLLGPAQGLADLDEVIGLGGLERYPYAFGARAQMLAALGRSRTRRLPGRPQPLGHDRRGTGLLRGPGRHRG